MQVTLNMLPASLAEFRNLSLNTPDEVVAGFLCALNLYVKNPNEGVEAMNILRGPRPIKLRQKPSTGEWFLWEYSSPLSGIRTPAAQDPWA